MPAELLAQWSDYLYLTATGVVVLALAVAILQMLRTRRRGYALVALATLAWFLSGWTLIASRYAFLRDALGAWTLGMLLLLCQVTFLVLTLAVFRFVWGWPRLPRRWTARKPPTPAP